MSKIVKRVMDAKARKKWTAALRSRKFKQGIGTLRETLGEGDDRHCCLGVAVCAIDNKQPSTQKVMLSRGKYGLSLNLQSALALINDGSDKREIAEYFQDAGYDNVPTVRKTDDGDYKASFGSIANWIDKNL